MNHNTVNVIKKFISNVKNESEKNIELGYVYSEEDDLYRIWHNYIDFDDLVFNKMLGRNIRVFFYENDIFNIAVCYDREKAKALKKIFNIQGKTELSTKLHDFNTPVQISNKPFVIKHNVSFQGNSSVKMNQPNQTITLVTDDISNVYNELGEVA